MRKGKISEGQTFSIMREAYGECPHLHVDFTCYVSGGYGIWR